MAFNFNWSPLAADESFYERARDLLTTALNKNPKPPIIVDDILVTELNLGNVPPELEILEIGDLAEDRFRGIFKMCYTGDAYLTLKTRVQANPLNTYLSAKPSFTSPQPLAAAAGLTIPLSITLSEIKLSAFVILVFSKQKGLTIVFRNDPLESIKVSSTFDSIQFVRDYLQKTIEGQLRNLFMDELPSIIHKLSLRLWCPDQLPREDADASKENADDEVAVDPFAAPPPDAVDSRGHVLDANELASISLDGGAQLHSLFSQKNLLKLAALNESHRTLSLFTPGIQNAMFRAWLGPMDRANTGTSTPLATPSLVRTHSVQGSSTTYTFTDAASTDSGSISSRPSLLSLNSATTGLTLSGGKKRMSRRKKTRVVNLRRSKNDTVSETTSEAEETATETDSVAGPSSEPMPSYIQEDPEEAVPQAEPSPRSVRFRHIDDKIMPSRSPLNMEIYNEPVKSTTEKATKASMTQKEKAAEAMSNNDALNLERKRNEGSETSSVILEQAWITKMAGEIARRVYDEKQRNPTFWAERDDVPPPAYEATQ
ncbi:ERMES complex subunit [Neopestalotiopsis sp. 37M]|nr:ERMES complex subunit [Neopestalotiopsis sp. 37M]